MKKLLAIWACLRARWAKAKAPALSNLPIPIPPQGTKPMAAVDLSPLAAEFDAVSAYLAKLASGSESAVQLQADLDAEKKAHADTQALLEAANRDAAASAQAVLDMAAKYASLVPAA